MAKLKTTSVRLTCLALFMASCSDQSSLSPAEEELRKDITSASLNALKPSDLTEAKLEALIRRIDLGAISYRADNLSSIDQITRFDLTRSDAFRNAPGRIEAGFLDQSSDAPHEIESAPNRLPRKDDACVQKEDRSTSNVIDIRYDYSGCDEDLDLTGSIRVAGSKDEGRVDARYRADITAEALPNFTAITVGEGSLKGNGLTPDSKEFTFEYWDDQAGYAEYDEDKITFALEFRESISRNGEEGTFEMTTAEVVSQSGITSYGIVRLQDGRVLSDGRTLQVSAHATIGGSGDSLIQLDGLGALDGKFELEMSDLIYDPDLCEGNEPATGTITIRGAQSTGTLTMDGREGGCGMAKWSGGGYVRVDFLAPDYQAFEITTPLPYAPSNLIATATSSTSISLNWQDNSQIETKFEIERNGQVLSATAQANQVELTDTEVTPVSEYSYRIRAVGAGGVSEWSNVVTVSTPEPPPLSNVVALCAGANHSCAVITTGGVKCWGDNRNGQLGTGEIRASSAPTSAAGITTARAIGCGASHSCAVMDDGSLRCWGDNARGQLGNGTQTDSSVAVPVADIGPYVRVTGGKSHSCALSQRRTISCWGGNDHGVLGNGSKLDSANPVVVPEISDATDLASGSYHTCAVRSDGSVACWGRNASGQLGNGSTADSNIPVTVSHLAGVASVSAGGGHSCARIQGGSIMCWGLNTDGQLGDGTSSNSAAPVAVLGLANAVSVSAGSGHSCAVLVDGSVYCWGDNTSDKLGVGNIAKSAGPIPVNAVLGAAAVATGDTHSCAVSSEGTVDCWGDNSMEQLGHWAPWSVAIFSSETPVKVSDPD